jgi:hypothetical protein
MTSAHRRAISASTGGLGRESVRLHASAVFSALLTFGAIALGLGVLAAAAPAAAAPLVGQAAQVVPTLAGTPAPPPQFPGHSRSGARVVQQDHAVAEAARIDEPEG